MDSIDKNLVLFYAPPSLTAALLALVLYLVWWRVRFLDRCIATTGEVLEVDVRSTQQVRDGKMETQTKYFARISFLTRDSQPHEFWHEQGLGAFMSSMVTGQKVYLRYDPANIGTVFVGAGLWAAPIAALVFTLACGAATVLFFNDVYPDILHQVLTAVGVHVNAMGG